MTPLNGFAAPQPAQNDGKVKCNINVVTLSETAYLIFLLNLHYDLRENLQSRASFLKKDGSEAKLPCSFTLVAYSVSIVGSYII